MESWRDLTNSQTVCVTKVRTETVLIPIYSNIAFIALLSIALNSNASPSFSKESERALDIKTIVDTNNYRIHFTIKSLSKTQTELFKADLPWVFPQAIAISAMSPIGDGLPLKRHFDSIGLPPGVVQLKPNQSISGWVNLYERFEGFPKRLKLDDIACMWVYRPMSVSGELLGVYKGLCYFESSAPDTVLKSRAKQRSKDP